MFDKSEINAFAEPVVYQVRVTVRPKTYEGIVDLVDEFKKIYPKLTKAAEDPLLVQNECGFYNHIFVVYWTAIGADLEQLQCVRNREWPHHSWKSDPSMPTTLDTWAHCMAVVGDWFIDWTAKQFNVHAPTPLIIHRDELLCTWEIVGGECEQVPYYWALGATPTQVDLL